MSGTLPGRSPSLVASGGEQTGGDNGEGAVHQAAQSMDVISIEFLGQFARSEAAELASEGELEDGEDNGEEWEQQDELVDDGNDCSPLQAPAVERGRSALRTTDELGGTTLSHFVGATARGGAAAQTPSAAEEEFMPLAQAAPAETGLEAARRAVAGTTSARCSTPAAQRRNVHPLGACDACDACLELRRAKQKQR